MEGDVWRRQLVDSKAYSSDPTKNLISRMRVSNFDSHVKKDILLMLIEKGLSKISAEEWRILEAIDLLKELHRSEGSQITPAIAAASSTLATSITTIKVAINNVKNAIDNAPSSPAQKAHPVEIPKDDDDNQLHKDTINLEEEVMDPTTDKIDLVEIDSSTSKIDPDPSTNKNHEVPNETTSAPTNVNHPSAHSHHSNDSIEELLGGKSNSARRLHLPSPKRKRVSPLNSYKTPKFTRRRKVKRWSRFEEETLKTAIRLYGEGNWKKMLDSYPNVFDERTTGDLKDKCRNMKASGL